MRTNLIKLERSTKQVKYSADKPVSCKFHADFGHECIRTSALSKTATYSEVKPQYAVTLVRDIYVGHNNTSV